MLKLLITQAWRCSSVLAIPHAPFLGSSFPSNALRSQLAKPRMQRQLTAFSGFSGNGLHPIPKLAATGSSIVDPFSPDSPEIPEDALENRRLSQVIKRLEQAGRYFKRLGSMGFWSQLVCIVVSAGITAFSSVITGKITSPPTFYLNVAGIAAGFISVFWSFGYIRLGGRLQKTDPKKAPPRADVVKNIKNGIMINLFGMGATILGMQATVGVLVAKALTSSAAPVLQAPSPSYSPVLALDVFLVQASANALLSHFLGLLFSLELLRSVTLSQHSSENMVAKPA